MNLDMMKISQRLLILFSFAFVLLSANVQAGSLQNMQGGDTTLEAQMEKGKWTVVMLWASDCHICAIEAPDYAAFHAKYSNINAKVVGVSSDGAEKKQAAEAFVKNHKLNFPNLIGDVYTVASLYQEQTGEAFRGTPTFMVFDPDGKLMAAQPGAVPPEDIERFIAAN